jgi:hypothetical protein
MKFGLSQRNRRPSDGDPYCRKTSLAIWNHIAESPVRGHWRWQRWAPLCNLPATPTEQIPLLEFVFNPLSTYTYTRWCVRCYNHYANLFLLSWSFQIQQIDFIVPFF